MAVLRIDDPDDLRIADFRDVRDPELVRRRGLFVAEGALVLPRVLEAGELTLRALLLTDEALRGLGGLVGRIDPRTPVYTCALPVLRRVSGFHRHRGWLALVERPPERDVDAVVAPARLMVVLDGVANADNVGAVFRNAAAFGADGVLLSPTTCDPLYRRAIRASVAATLQVPFARVSEWPAALARLRAQGIALVALTPESEAMDIEQFMADVRPHRGRAREAVEESPGRGESLESLAAGGTEVPPLPDLLRGPEAGRIGDEPVPEQGRGRVAAGGRPSRIALMLGSEGAGLRPDVKELADYRVRIAMRPGIDSINIATAAAIALHRLAQSIDR